MSEWMTLSEGARRVGVSRSALQHARRAGRLEARPLPDGRLVVSVSAVDAYGAQWAARQARVASRRSAGLAAWSPRRTVDAGPLLDLVAARGGPAACGVEQGSAELEALRLAKFYGRVTPRAAEQLAVGVLGLTPWDLWPAGLDS